MFLEKFASPYLLLLVPFLYYILPYIREKALIRIPGPFAARFTNLWLMKQCRQGKRYKAVDAAHKKYGKVVRIQPHHVSIADPDAIPIIYGHGNGFLKRYGYNSLSSSLTAADVLKRVLRRLRINQARPLQHKGSR